jgi:hypothetical protein
MSVQIAEGATSEETEEIEETELAETTEGETALGDAGKKALDLMKTQRNAATTRAKAAELQIAELIAAAELKDKPAEEQALETARAEARAEGAKSANVRILKSELRAAATGKLADPTDASLYINLDTFDVDENGDVDADALNEAITDLLEKKPHLAAQRQNRFNGDADGGAKGKDSKPAQLSKSDLEGLSPQQIVEAKAAGRLNALLGIK